jgi:hypothetical protein
LAGRFHLNTNLFKSKNTAKNVTPTPTKSVTPSPTRKVTPGYRNPTTVAQLTQRANPGTQRVTPTRKAPVTTKGGLPVYNNNQTGGNPVANNNISTIPNTGAETFILPLAFSMLGGGLFLKKRSHK